MTHASVDALLRSHPPFARRAPEARNRLAALASARGYERGETVFREGEASELLITIASGRVKVVKMLPAAREMIVEILGPGDPLLEPTECLLFRRAPGKQGLVRTEAAGFVVVDAEALRRLAE